MRFINSLAVLALAAVTSAAAVTPNKIVRNGVEIRADKKVCLCQSDVDELVDAYRRMLTSWDDEDAKYLAEEFYDHSDSINMLAGLQPGAIIFPSKEAFIEHQHVQPDAIPLVIERKGPFNCNEISFIWSAKFGNPATALTARGITILGATHVTGKWQISAIDVEFNNIAYLSNIGGTYTLPTFPPATTS